VWSDDIYFMVLTREFFATFTDKPIADPNESVQDYGFMYSRDLDDPDGNSLGFLYMSEEAAEKGPEAYMAEQGGEPA